MKDTIIELIKNDIEFLEWLYATIGDDKVDYMVVIDDRIKRLNKLKGDLNSN